MCNLTENDMWKRLGFCRLISHYLVLNNATRSVSSLVYRLLLNAIKTFLRYYPNMQGKTVSYHILFHCQLTKPFLPPEWSSDGHLHLSLQNPLSENNLLILSLAYHLIIRPNIT